MELSFFTSDCLDCISAAKKGPSGANADKYTAVQKINCVYYLVYGNWICMLPMLL